MERLLYLHTLDVSKRGQRFYAARKSSHLRLVTRDRKLTKRLFVVAPLEGALSLSQKRLHEEDQSVLLQEMMLRFSGALFYCHNQPGPDLLEAAAPSDQCI
jgi:hypothetical protein